MGSRTVNYKGSGSRTRLKTKEKGIGNRAQATKVVNNKGDEESVALSKGTNDHFTIHKGSGSIDIRAAKLLAAPENYCPSTETSRYHRGENLGVKLGSDSKLGNGSRADEITETSPPSE
jgi:hypothetical protein